MLSAQQVVQQLLPLSSPLIDCSKTVFAPSNIALAKYWGKRCHALNLPMNDSLSISLGHYGATAQVKRINETSHQIVVNHQHIDPLSTHGQQYTQYLDLFAPHRFALTLKVNIPIAAGLASSACLFAATATAIYSLFKTDDDLPTRSILARLGSGSAARSVTHGFMRWRAGVTTDGMDSFAESLCARWPELRVGILLVDTAPKPLSSRLAMRRTQALSPLYPLWPAFANQSVHALEQHIQARDFDQFGSWIEHNANTMHATIHSTPGRITFTQADTVALQQSVIALRQSGVPVYYTQDAGPNLKILFLADSTAAVIERLQPDHIIHPFGAPHDE